MDDINMQYEYGYFRATVKNLQQDRLLTSNNERAFIISQLQDILAFRSSLSHPYPHKHISHRVDLLAYSISGNHIDILTFALSRKSVLELCDTLTTLLESYRFEHTPAHRAITNRYSSSTSVSRLENSYQALQVSTDIHLGHDDWEFDRYSSIGFYLHDRRGDWMRIWRIASLYDNDASTYRDALNLRSKYPKLHHGWVKDMILNKSTSLTSNQSLETNPHLPYSVAGP